MQIRKRPIVVIPAFDEEAWIGRTIKLTIKAGIKARDIVVVDDGSKDKTTEIAQKLGCRVIRFKKNLGKTNAFYAGIKMAIKMGASSVVSLDADMLKIPRKNLQELIWMAEQANKEKRIKMINARVFEGNHNEVATTFHSGIRSFSLAAIYGIIQSRYKSISKGYALERFLNRLFKEKQRELLMRYDINFMARAPGADEIKWKKQDKDTANFIKKYGLGESLIRIKKPKKIMLKKRPW